MIEWLNIDQQSVRRNCCSWIYMNVLRWKFLSQDWSSLCLILRYFVIPHSCMYWCFCWSSKQSSGSFIAVPSHTETRTQCQTSIIVGNVLLLSFWQLTIPVYRECRIWHSEDLDHQCWSSMPEKLSLRAKMGTEKLDRRNLLGTWLGQGLWYWPCSF